MLNYKTMTIDDIIDWCKENGKKDWLKAFAAPDKKGKKPTFFQIRKAFCTKFMPEIIPTAKPKEPNMYDKIDNL